MVSRSQITNLGSRLRRGTTLEDDDDLLRSWIRSHDSPLREVSGILAVELALQNTPRLKTRRTLEEKLVREKTNLVNMDDVAGIRLDSSACGITSRMVQDEVADMVRGRFPTCKVKDRRASPRHGYRAVHIVVRHGQRLIEVQVRTELQHQWAEITEKLGDIVGRGLRYGEMPVNPLAAQLHLRLIDLAELAELVETTECELADLEDRWAADPPEERDEPQGQAFRKDLDDLGASVEDSYRRLHRLLAGIRDDVVEFENALGGYE